MNSDYGFTVTQTDGTMKRISYFFVFFFACYLSAFAQDKGYSIRLTIKGLRDSTCYLSHYFGYTQHLLKDTAKIDTSGVLLFEGKQPLPEGLYFVTLPQKRRVEFIWLASEPTFSITSDTLDLIGNARVEGSQENIDYFAYLKYVKTQTDQMEAIRTFGGGPSDNNPMLQQRLRTFRNEMYSYLNRLASDYGNRLIGKYIRAVAEPRLPMPPRYANGGYDTAFVSRAVRQHFFDNIDFSDERMVRSPFLQRRLDTYFDRVAIPQIDSLKAACDRIISLASANKEVLRYTVWNMSNLFETAKIIGTDAIFVHLAEEYYLKGKVETDSSVLKNLAERVKTLKPLLIGETMPPLVLTDPNDKIHSLQNLSTNLTFVVFYDPLCQKCRAKMPKLIDFYKKHKTESISLYAVMVERNEKLWKNMLDEFKIKDLWINVWDKTGKINYKKDFDIYGTPVIYVLNKEKKIVLKRLEVEQLEAVLELYNQNKLATVSTKK